MVKSKQFLKKCPSCEKIIYYSHKYSSQNAKKNKTLCAKCGHNKFLDRQSPDDSIKKITVLKDFGYDKTIIIQKNRKEIQDLWEILESGLIEKLRIKKRERSPQGSIVLDKCNSLAFRVQKTTNLSIHKIRIVLSMFKSRDPICKQKIFSNDWISIYELYKEFRNYQKEGIWKKIHFPSIYFLQATLSKRIKIGFSKDPSTRLKHWESSNSEDLIFLHSIPGDRKKESKLLNAFKSSRVPNRLEWFEPTQEILDYIEELKKNN